MTWQVSRLEAEGRLPDALVACVGGGSNAIGLFHPFLADEGVRLVETFDHTITAEFEGQDDDMARLLGVLISAGVVVQSFAEEPLSLEEVFMMITTGIVN